jgi:hypothetical protein
VKRFANAARTQDVNLYGCGRLADAALVALLAASQALPPHPSRTKWTRLVHPSVLIGHAPRPLSENTGNRE